MRRVRKRGLSSREWSDQIPSLENLNFRRSLSSKELYTVFLHLWSPPARSWLLSSSYPFYSSRFFLLTFKVWFQRVSFHYRQILRGMNFKRSYWFSFCWWKNIILFNYTGYAWGPTLASVVNAGSIMILNYLYGILAVKMNDFENHRTETAYQNALIWKTFLFQFVNSKCFFHPSKLHTAS
jgi:hypothetical protein